MAQGRPAEPVRLYTDDDARLPVRLKKVLQERIDSVSEAVLTGQLSDRDYRYQAGQLQGLRDALSVCEIISKELSGT